MHPIKIGTFAKNMLLPVKSHLVDRFTALSVSVGKEGVSAHHCMLYTDNSTLILMSSRMNSSTQCLFYFQVYVKGESFLRGVYRKYVILMMCFKQITKNLRGFEQTLIYILTFSN